MTDAELTAMAAIVFAQSVEVLAANQYRAHIGSSPAYSGVDSEELTLIEKEMQKRRESGEDL